MLALLKFPCIRVLSAARGPFRLRSCIKDSYCRNQAVNVYTRRQRSIHCSSVLGYADSSSGIEVVESEGCQEGEGVASESVSSSADTCGPSQPSECPPSLELQNLPELPPFPAKPTLHIFPEDITTYIQPLISRQWRVGHVQKGSGEREVLSLNRTFDFKGFNDAMNFIQEVADVSRTEKHHARILTEYNTVIIFTHTHSAHIFRRLPNGRYESRKVRGLTRRDIRFAMKVDELHDKFKAQGRVLENVPTNLGELQRQSMHALLRRYGKTQPVEKMEDVQKQGDKVSSDAVTPPV